MRLVYKFLLALMIAFGLSVSSPLIIFADGEGQPEAVPVIEPEKVEEQGVSAEQDKHLIKPQLPKQGIAEKEKRLEKDRPIIVPDSSTSDSLKPSAEEKTVPPPIILPDEKSLQNQPSNVPETAQPEILSSTPAEIPVESLTVAPLPSSEPTSEAPKSPTSSSNGQVPQEMVAPEQPREANPQPLQRPPSGINQPEPIPQIPLQPSQMPTQDQTPPVVSTPEEVRPPESNPQRSSDNILLSPSTHIRVSIGGLVFAGMGAVSALFFNFKTSESMSNYNKSASQSSINKYRAEVESNKTRTNISLGFVALGGAVSLISYLTTDVPLFYQSHNIA